MEEHPEIKHTPRPASRRRKKIVLPFERRKFDPATWVYDHRIGLCVTVIAYLVFGIVVVSAKIVIRGSSDVHSIYIDLTDVPPVEREMTPEQIRQLEEELTRVQNQISNETATTIAERALPRTAEDRRIEAEAEAVADRLRANREAYERGLREEQEMIEAHNNRNNRPQQNSAQQSEDVRIKGSVAISFSLDGRSFVYMHKPSYQCEGGGEVVVDITVNRNGDVVSASLNSISSNDVNCHTERALHSARISRFNVDPSAPARQQGTITYLFVPQ